MALIFKKGECGRHFVAQFLGLTKQGYRTVELYKSPARIIKRNALSRAFLYNNGYTTISFRRLSNFKMKLTR